MKTRRPLFVTWGILGILLTACASGANNPGNAPAAGQLRIVTDPPGATIFCDGTVQDITPLTLTGLTPGPHLIVAQKPGHEEVRQTVTLTAGQRAALELKLEPMTGLVLVDSAPTGADIEIDGGHRGTAPLLLTDLAVGKHRIVATSQGYAPRDVDLTISDRTPRKVVVELASSSARLTVTSVPPGASVTVNGTLRGTTPAEVDRLPTGESELVVESEGYFAQRQKFKLQAGDAQRIHVALKPIPATLTVLSVPPGAQVYVDEQLRKDTPVAVEGLEPGKHVVRVELEGYETDTRPLELAKAEKRTEEFRLTRNSGTLEIVTEPSGVKVFVDGKERGTTAAGTSDLLSQPLTVDLLSLGQHRLQLSRTGCFPVEKTFMVEPNKTVPLHESLKRRFIPDTIVRVGTGPSDVREGCVTRRHPNGDIELETKPGIFLTIKAAEIVSVEAVPVEGAHKP